VNILWRLDEASEKVVYSLKFDGRDDVATSVARQLTSTELPFFDLISFVPDTSARRRKRGYVAPQLVARELSRLTRKPYVELLPRTNRKSDLVVKLAGGRLKIIFAQRTCNCSRVDGFC
jgi:predicted amidophosphoribosyltransferase